MPPDLGATPLPPLDPRDGRVTVDEALRASLARNAVILESALDCIIATDRDGRIIEINAEAERTFGWSRAELVGRDLVATVIPESLRDDHRRGLARYLATGEAKVLGRRIETVGLRADGREFPVELAITTAYVAGAPIFVASLRDITERKHAEAELRRLQGQLETRVLQRTRELEAAKRALETEVAERRLAEARIRESEEELRVYVDHMATFTAKVSPDGAFLLVNRMAQLGSGLDEEELMRTNFLDGRWWASEESRRHVRDALRRAAAGESVTYDTEILVFGQITSVDFGLTPIRDADGRVRAIIAEARDVTPLKRAEERLRERAAQLKEANEELAAFSYSVSHDLRAPLRAIEGFAHILREDFAPSLPGEARRLVDRVEEGARRMSRLIDDILAFSRLGQRPVERRPIALRPLVERVLGDLVDPRESSRIEVSIEALPDCEADPRMVEQVFVNLLANALKFSRTREVARIAVGCRPVSRPGAPPVYFVRDNGVGFDMEYADRLFGVFQRLHRAEEYEGVGVGLAIAQRIVYRHGGRIWAEAEPDRGAAFLFTLAPGDPS